MSQQWMIIITGVGLAGWVLIPPIAILAPRRQRDPHDGMAVGCLLMIMIPGVLLAGMFAAGLIWHIPLLVRITFYIVVVPLVLVALNLLVVLP